MLKVRQVLVAAVGHDSRKILIVSLGLPEYANSYPVMWSNAGVDASHAESCSCAVYLNRRAIAPRFFKEAATQKSPTRVGNSISQGCIDGRVLRICLCVDQAAL